MNVGAVLVLLAALAITPVIANLFVSFFDELRIRRFLARTERRALLCSWQPQRGWRFWLIFTRRYDVTYLDADSRLHEAVCDIGLALRPKVTDLRVAETVDVYSEASASVERLQQLIRGNSRA